MKNSLLIIILGAFVLGGIFERYREFKRQESKESDVVNAYRVLVLEGDSLRLATPKDMIVNGFCLEKYQDLSDREFITIKGIVSNINTSDLYKD